MKKTLTLLVLLIIFALALGSCDNSENPTDTSASGNNNTPTDNIFSLNNYGSISEEDAKARKEYSFRLSNLNNILAYNNCLFFHAKNESCSIDGSSNGTAENIMFYDTTYSTDTPMSAFFESIGSLPFDVDRMFIRYFLVDEYTLETTVAFEYTQNDEDLIELQVVYGDEWVVNVLKYEDRIYTGSYAYAYYNSKSGVWQEFDLS